MSLQSKLRRLRRMPAAEIASRCRDKWRLSQDRLSLWLPKRTIRLDRQRIGKACQEIVPGMDGKQIFEFRRTNPNRCDAVAAAVTRSAEKIMSGQIKLLGETIDLESRQWHKDPLSNYRWPQRFFADVPIYELDADVKYVWELNRHQFLPTLSQAWLFTGKSEYAEQAIDVMLDWIESNPIYLGVNWTSALEVALRSISWIWTIAGIRNMDRWTDDAAGVISQSLFEHATYLSNHLSYYSSPFNHLIGEAAALYMLAHVLDERPEAERWRRRSMDALSNRKQRQFYDDGFTVEQATGYHFFTLGFFLQALVTARHRGESNRTLESLVETAAIAGSQLRRPDGTWPCIGDIDSARSIPTVHENFWDFRGINALAAAFFGNAELGAPFREQTAESFWMLGSNANHWLNDLPTCQERPIGVLPHAGYAFWSSGKDDWVLMDCGPVGDGVHRDNTPSVAHGHDDALSVYLRLDGHDVLHDSGMLRYAGSRNWVDYFRSAEAHNGIVIDDTPCMRNAGRLAWSNVEQETSLAAEFLENAAFFRGCLRIGDRARLERHLMIRGDSGLWIVDQVSLDTPRAATWHWHLPQSTQARLTENGTIHAATLQIRTWCSEEVGRSVEPHSKNSPVACHAPGYGERKGGYRVRLRALAPAMKMVMVTHIGSPSVELELTNIDDQAILFKSTQSVISIPASLDRVNWRLHSPTPIVYRVEGRTRQDRFGRLKVTERRSDCVSNT